MKGVWKYSINSWGVSRYYSPPKRRNYSGSFNYENFVGLSGLDREIVGLSGLDQSKENLNKGFKRNQELSKNSRRKIISLINWLALSSKLKTYKTKKGKVMSYRLQMITLTFVGDIEEKESKKLLNNWLTNVRENYGVKNYIWKIELTKKGRIHYHIITDSDLTLDKTTKTWNLILQNNGFIGQYEVNSTDVKRFSKATTYIAKYLGKSEKTENSLTGRIWGSNRELNAKKIKENLKELAEFTYYHAEKLKVNVMRVDLEFANIIVFDLRRLFILKDYKKEFLKKLREVVEPYPRTHTDYNPEIEELFKTSTEIKGLANSHGYGID